MQARSDIPLIVGLSGELCHFAPLHGSTLQFITVSMPRWTGASMMMFRIILQLTVEADFFTMRIVNTQHRLLVIMLFLFGGVSSSSRCQNE